MELGPNSRRNYDYFVANLPRLRHFIEIAYSTCPHRATRMIFGLLRATRSPGTYDPTISRMSNNEIVSPETRSRLEEVRGIGAGCVALFDEVTKQWREEYPEDFSSED